MWQRAAWCRGGEASAAPGRRRAPRLPRRCRVGCAERPQPEQSSIEKRRRPRRAAATVERELDELDRKDAEDDVALRPRVLLVESMTTCSSSSSGGDCQRMACSCRAEGAQLRCSAHGSSGLPTHRMFELCRACLGCRGRRSCRQLCHVACVPAMEEHKLAQCRGPRRR